MKTVKYNEYKIALNEIELELEPYANAGFEYRISIVNDDEPIELQINWSAKGDVDLDNAEKFAEGLNRAIELARDFKYNGYMLEYC